MKESKNTDQNIQVALCDEKTSAANQLQKHWKTHFHFAN